MCSRAQSETRRSQSSIWNRAAPASGAHTHGSVTAATAADLRRAEPGRHVASSPQMRPSGSVPQPHTPVTIVAMTHASLVARIDTRRAYSNHSPVSFLRHLPCNERRRIPPSGASARRLGRRVPRAYRGPPSHEPGTSRRDQVPVPGLTAGGRRAPLRGARIAGAGRPPRDHALESSGLLCLLPLQHGVCVGPRGHPRVRARRAGDELADVARRDRNRGGSDGLAPPDGGALVRLVGRHPRHRQHCDALRAPVCAREGIGVQPARRGPASGRSAARRVRLRARAQLDREGGAPGGLRPVEPAAHRHRRRARARPPAAGAGDRDRSGGRAPSGSDRGGDRDDGHDGDRSAGGDRGAGRAARRVAACRRGDGGHGDGAAGVPVDVGGRGARRQRGPQPAQVDGSRVRFQCLLRSRPRASGAGHEHEPELPAGRPRTAR